MRGGVRVTNPKSKIQNPKCGVAVVVALIVLSAVPASAELKLSLADSLKLYSQKSRQVKMLQNEAEAKAYLIKKAESLKKPSLDADINYNFLDSEPKSKTPFGSLAMGQDKYLKGQLVLSHIIYDFGQRDSIIGKAVLDRELTKLYLKKDLNDGGLEIAFIFYRTLSLKNTKEVYEEELKVFRDHKRRIDAFYQEGLITRNEVLQINVEINNSRQKILTAENEILNLKARLKTLLNTTEDIELIDADGLKNDFSYNESTIYKNRPEALITEKLVRLKDLDLTQADADYYPKFYGATGVNYEDNKYREEDYNMFLTVGLKVNLYGGGRTASEKLSIIKSRQEMEEKLRQAKDMIKLDADSAGNDLRTALSRIDMAKEAIEQANENLRIQQSKYEELVITATDLIDATLLLSRTNLNYHNAVFGYKTSFARFLWAKGELHAITQEQ
jgi:outer membrane protein